MTYPYTARSYNEGFKGLLRYLGRDLISDGFGGWDPKVVDTGHWQSLKGTPHSKSVEMMNVVIEYDIPPDRATLAAEIAPNLPWADQEFDDRTSGQPFNPHPSVVNWPWFDPDWRASEGGRYSHTYSERYWPHGHSGVRFKYGDLQDVVSLLAEYPGTRQAYLPVWFPEDTGAVHGERVPCSLGYHWLAREGQLHCNYFIRSCDFLRYLQDDVYLTCRLTQWIYNQLYQRFDVDPGIEPGRLTMFIGSLHVFEGDLPKMRRLYAPQAGKR